MGRKGETACAAIAVFAAIGVAALAQTKANAIIWHLSRTQDPITDGFNTVAIIQPEPNNIGFAIRCKNSKTLDFFVRVSEMRFRVGETTSGVIRFGSATPEPFKAVATEPSLLAIDFRKTPHIPQQFLTSENIAIRYLGPNGQEQTLVWQAAIKPNALHAVGRVLSDCGVIDYPQSQIDAADKEVTGK